MFLQAAEQDYAPAQYYVGVDFREGYGVKKDIDQALLWLLKAAEQGLAPAQNDYAFQYFYGKDGIPAQPEKAIPWLLKAAEQGYAHSQTLLAEAYLLGKGTEANPAEAFHWARPAAESGHPYAKHLLGVMLMTGKGTERDHTAAQKWLGEAAVYGIPDAQLQMALFYKVSETHQDVVKALAWYNIYLSRSGNAPHPVMEAVRDGATDQQRQLAREEDKLIRKQLRRS